MESKKIVKNEYKDVYIMIIYTLNKNESTDNLSFKTDIPESIENIYTEKRESDKTLEYIRVCKFSKKETKKVSKSILEFKINEDLYTIDLIIEKGQVFIFEIDLLKTDSYTNRKTLIKQDKIKNYQKMEYFMKAIQNKDKNEKLLKILYSNTIQLYYENPKFDFLINLFIQVYKYKEALIELLNKFRETKDKSSQINSITNYDIDNFLKHFDEICKEGEKVISEENKSKEIAINFYGLFFLYFK